MSANSTKHAANAMDDLDAVLTEAAAVVADSDGQEYSQDGTPDELKEFHGRSITTAAQLRGGPDRSELPDELRNADKGDTSCDVCGVSFLVYSEMKVCFASMADWRFRW